MWSPAAANRRGRLRPRRGAGDEIVVALPGTSLKVTYRKPAGEPGLVASNVICCSTIVRFNRRQRGIFNAQVRGRLAKDVAAELIEHVKGCSVLTRAERLFVIAALETYCAE